MQDIQTQRKLYDTKYAAIYYPRVIVYDEVANAGHHLSRRADIWRESMPV